MDSLHTIGTAYGSLSKMLMWRPSMTAKPSMLKSEIFRWKWRPDRWSKMHRASWLTKKSRTRMQLLISLLQNSLSYMIRLQKFTRFSPDLRVYLKLLLLPNGSSWIKFRLIWRRWSSLFSLRRFNLLMTLYHHLKWHVKVGT